MLDHHRRKVIEILGSTQSVTLSTCGPAGVQAQMLPCAARGMRLYLLVPATSEHLFNLEQAPGVVATTAEWQLHGVANVLSPPQAPADLFLSDAAASGEFILVEVRPLRLHIGRPNGRGFSDTLDILEEQSLLDG